MHAAGLSSLFFGIESGSKRMQQVIKKQLDFDRFEPILKRINQLNIGATTAFILGFPEEGLVDMDQTVWRALHYRNLGTSRVFFSKLAALSGTQLYKEHLPSLHNLAHPSSISPQAYCLPYIKQLIQDYPELFSSYYHIPHPEMDCDELWKFIEFCQLVVNGSPKLALMLIDELAIPASKLFQLWDRWAAARDIAYFDYKVFGYVDFKVKFSRFIKELDVRSLSDEASDQDTLLPVHYEQLNTAALH